MSQEFPSKIKNFWNSCPRILDYFPNSPCPLGKPPINSKEIPPCPWSVNSEIDNYCFWSWVRRHSNEDGLMEPLHILAIAELMGSSSAKILASYKEVIEKIKNFEEYQDLKELFE